MQNLLPLLAIKPTKVVQLKSAGVGFDSAAKSIEMAAREAGLDAGFETVELGMQFPEIADIKDAIDAVIHDAEGAIFLNITGGTKLMSIGAYWAGCQLRENAHVLYCDSAQQRFISVGTVPLPSQLPSFASTVASLTVRMVMAAHGKSPGSWRFDRATEQGLLFGRRAFELRLGEADAFKDCQFSESVRQFFRSDNGRIPDGRARLESLLTLDVCGAIGDPIPDAVNAYFEAASKGGFLKSLDGGGWRLALAPDGVENKKELKRHVESVANILDGSWLELAVLDLISQSDGFFDPHWSVEPRRGEGDDGTGSFGETDLVCLRPAGALQVISCKTKIKQPLEHIESLSQRSRNLGGQFAQAMLVLLDSQNSKKEKEIRSWARHFGVEVLIGEEIRKLGGTNG